MFLIIRRSKKRIMEYVPEGRIEPLEEVEARLRPELGAGVSIEHMPLPPASTAAGSSGALPALPSAAPISTSTTTMAIARPALPSTTDSTNADPGKALPALPPAKAQSESSYGLYSPQAGKATPASAAQVPLTSAGGYKPATATAALIKTATTVENNEKS